MVSSTLSKRIQSAWDSRWGGRLEETLKLLPELSAELGFQLLGVETHDREQEWKKNAASTREGLLKADAILLGASILRLQGKLNETKNAIERAQECLISVGLAGSFRFHFERGLLQYVQGYSLSALEDFFAAERLTKVALLRLLSLSNVMLCMENVGIDHDNILKEVNALRRELSKSTHPVYLSNERQILAYEMRTLFRRGNIKGALSLRSGVKFRVNHQASFYARYLKLLPYSSVHQPLSNSEIQILLKEPESFYQKGYLTRTLLGNLHANDQEMVKLSDRIDRLYLWVWMWLDEPERFGTERLMNALNEVLIHFNPNKMTLEDQALLRNSLGWIILVDPSISMRVKTVLEQVSSGSGHFPIFDFESTLIQLIQAKRLCEKMKINDTLKQLKRHSLWNSTEIHLSRLITDTNHPITKRILDEKNSMTIRQKNVSLLVDLNTFAIQLFYPEVKIVSEPMALGLQLILSRESIRCEEFAEVVFGFKHFDSFVHLPKINNLISRIKMLTKNELMIRVRAGTITALKSVQFKVEFIEPAKLTRLLRAQTALKAMPQFEKKETSKNGLKIGVLLERFGHAAHFSRDDAQVVFSKSKSTTNRFLENLLVRKVIAREGDGKSTRYFFVRQELRYS